MRESDIPTGKPDVAPGDAGKAPGSSQVEIGPQGDPREKRSRLRATAKPHRFPERVPALQDQAMTGEVPEELLNAIIDDVRKRIKVEPAAIEVTRSQAVLWSDGSLGCPQPGVVYTQAPVNGYWVVIDVAGESYDYRASDAGYFALCEGGIASIPSTREPGASTPPDE